MPAGETPTTLEAALELLKAKDAEVEEWRGHSRTWEQRAKDNKDAATERDAVKKQLEEAEAAKAGGLDEVGQLKKKLDELDAALKAEQNGRTAAEKQAMKVRIGAEKGLPAALVELLQGDDAEAISAHADKLLEVVPKVDPLTSIDTGAGKGGEQVKADAFKAAIDKALPDRAAE